MVFPAIASIWFLLERGWNFFISGERNLEYLLMVSFTALILIYGGYITFFESENLWGSLIAFLGVTLRIWGRAVLKESFSVRLKKPEKLIKNGPYALIRHPLYLGLALLCLGGVTASESRLLILPFSLNLFILIRKIIKEEKVLEELPEFKDYRKRTWRLIPFVW
ncbi:MAG: hypothetical protein N3C62_01165 [Synergistetes bacterium]|nr:hypothetical protein [Synergistota bacterium]MCX8127348.1 hypothetical protein [Synergistota bacterium]MDW8192212.1 isoprenylcysteine carboxylmethyltransferase family protein [Synergistota bacterium]